MQQAEIEKAVGFTLVEAGTRMITQQSPVAQSDNDNDNEPFLTEEDVDEIMAEVDGTSPAGAPTSPAGASTVEDHYRFQLVKKHSCLCNVSNEWFGLDEFADAYGGIEGRNKVHKNRWRKYLDSNLFSAHKRVVKGVEAYAAETKQDAKAVIAEWEDFFTEVKGSMGLLVKLLQGKKLIKVGKSKSNNNKNDDDNVDSTEVAGKRQRRSRSTPIQYTDPVSDQGEDSEDLIEYTVPVRKSTRKRKATRKAATRRKKSVTDVADDDSDNEAEPVAAANPDTSILEQKLLESDILLKQEQLRSIKAERALQEGKDLVAKLQAKLERYQGKPPPPGYQPDDDSTLREELNRVKEERNSYKHRLDARIDQGARVQELYRQNKLLREQLQEQGGEPMSVLLKRVDKLEARIKRRDMTILKLEQAAPNDTLSTAEPVAAVSPEKATDGEIIQSI
ncbi:expressed unknown protein [Seminavis robusta]|uniref:Uncharacterized protein n=1 Tax=Seminavis robusta TaxID=568900 RepID=A0A9N8EGV7_9STRA|nr:expressed unknown protein [Seminavis robusta]|eukprot:Sro927_g221120.1 n/a (448) ;mRNA; r:8037-9714